MNSRDLINPKNQTLKTRREDNKIALLKRSWKGNLNYYEITKDFDKDTKYDVWIYDDKSERQDTEKKYVHMYPFQTVNQGDYINFNNDPWLVTGVDKQYEYVQKGLMYKCINQRLRWVDEYGLHSFPIHSQSKVLRDPLLDNGKIFIADDSVEALLQYNEETIRIKENDRFTFGIGAIYKVVRVIDYFIDGIIKLVLKNDQVINGQDDFIKQIAYNKDYSYIINNGNNFEGNIGDEFKATASFTYDGNEIPIVTEWSIDDESIATIDQNGLIKFIDYGTTFVTATYNGLIDTKNIECANIVQEASYFVTPEIDKISIGEDRTYYIDKVVGSTTTILNSNITCSPLDINSFTFTVIDSNSYIISNISNIDTDIIVTIEDIDTGDIIEKTYRLRMW